jgi:TonB family protein
MSFNKSQALNAAKQYVLQRNVQAAVEVYREIVEADPTDLTAINTLGDLYASAGRTQEAMDQFSRVADRYIESGFTREAIATLKKLIAVDSANTETATKLADLYAQAGLPSEARQHYLQIAEALTRKGQTLDALSVYSKVVELDSSNTSTRIKLGELYLCEGMNEQAYDAFVTAAGHLAGKGENRRALNAYNEALAIRPDSVEVLAVARKLMTSLGIADPDRLRSPASPGAASGDLGNENSSHAGSDLRRPSTPLDQAQQSSDSFVVQEISKAERLVAYGQVNQAISMLRSVLKDQADSIDVHVKLKDIYLRTGMMIEAATECRELERIHEARGESDRARDYAIRAGRLTQLIEHPSGDLPEPERKPSEEGEPRANPAPLRIAEPQSAAPKTRPFASRLDAGPAQPSRMTLSVIPADAPAVVQAATIPPVDLPQASHSSPVEALPPVAEATLDAGLTSVSTPGQTALACVDVSARNLPALFASSLPVEKKRGRLTAAAIAAAVFVLLGVSAVIGGFAYDAHLDRQYQALALATPPLAAPSPPLALVSEELEPVPENEPITVVVTPAVQTDAPAQRQRLEPEVFKNGPALAAPQPVTEPPKVTTRPSPILPRTAVSPDSHTGTENRTPLGIPVDVPIGAAHPAEPPAKTVRRSPGVMTGSAVKRVDPVYPPAAREARLTGVVAVEVTISDQGNVTSARALSGPALLQNAAVLAARAWKFKASTLGGVPVTTTTTIIFNFKL